MKPLGLIWEQIWLDLGEWPNVWRLRRTSSKIWYDWLAGKTFALNRFCVSQDIQRATRNTFSFLFIFSPFSLTAFFFFFYCSARGCLSNFAKTSHWGIRLLKDPIFIVSLCICLLLLFLFVFLFLFFLLFFLVFFFRKLWLLGKQKERVKRQSKNVTQIVIHCRRIGQGIPSVSPRCLSSNCVAKYTQDQKLSNFWKQCLHVQALIKIHPLFFPRVEGSLIDLFFYSMSSYLYGCTQSHRGHLESLHAVCTKYSFVYTIAYGRHR